MRRPIETSNVQVDPSFKDRYTDDDFDYTETIKEPKKEEPEEREERIEPSTEAQPPKANIGGPLSTVFNIILIIAAGFLLFFIFQLVKDFRVEKKKGLKPIKVSKENEEDIEDLEELDPTDLKNLLLRAKTDGNFPLAIRFYFLMYLQKLQDRKLVTYHKDKTNADYRYELSNSKSETQFIKVAYLFEYIWYGKKPIDETAFASIEKIFIDQINQA